MYIRYANDSGLSGGTTTNQLFYVIDTTDGGTTAIRAQ